MKIINLIIIILLFNLGYSQDNVTIERNVEKRNFVELNEIVQFEKQINNQLRTELILYPSGLRFMPTIKNMNYGLGIGLTNNTDFYGKATVLYYWIPKYNLASEIFVNSEGKFKYYNIGLSLRKDFTFLKTSSFNYNVNLTTGISYNSLLNSATYDIGLGINVVGVTHYRKPVIYIYPKDTIQLDVEIDFKGEFTFTWPEYGDKWSLTVYPNSEIIDNKSRKRFKYLFWEGNYNRPEKDIIKTGFIVNRKDLIKFLPEKLEQIGLNDIEINDFITYWIPILEKDKYLIHFMINNECDFVAKYKFSKEPSSLIRVIALFIETDKAIISEQKLIKNKRTGFTIVEWGGTEY